MSPLKPDTIAELRTGRAVFEGRKCQESREVMQEEERELQIASMLCLCLQYVWPAQTLRMPSSREQAETI